MERRALLSLGVCLAGGCLGGGSSDPAASDTTASATDTSPVSTLPQGVPTPSEDCTVTVPGEVYPTLPSSLTESSATGFAVQYEKAYGRDDLQTDPDVDVSGFDGSHTSVGDRLDSGFVVRAEVSLDFTEDGYGTRTFAGSTVSTGWYYVSTSFAARAPNADGTRPTFGWEVVACD
ncbi:hypothetical protein [Haloarchaeobius sp. HRN-SO-5]|uniref:hypothetical protein n=1 Tax=Haloarchaeobius sp. HRN-SO-5 TaxID=3446118 RepID=UPI003EBB30FC